MPLEIQPINDISGEMFNPVICDTSVTQHVLKREPEPVFIGHHANSMEIEQLFQHAEKIVSRRHSEHPATTPAFSLRRASICTTGQSSGPSNPDEDDDCVLIGEEVPRPLQSTRDGLVKCQDDPISMNKPFITMVI